LVVLAIQDRVGYGKSFEEAMTNLFGENTRRRRRKAGEQQRTTSGYAAKPGLAPATPH